MRMTLMLVLWAVLAGLYVATLAALVVEALV